MAQMVKNLLAMQETWVRSLGQEDPWRRAWQPTPVFLPGKFHRQRSLVGYSLWGHKQLDTTERLHFHFHFLSLLNVRVTRVQFLNNVCKTSLHTLRSVGLNSEGLEHESSRQVDLCSQMLPWGEILHVTEAGPF